MDKDEFYIGYADGPGAKTRTSLRKFVIVAILFLLTGAFLFAFFQRKAVNSSFDFGNPTKITGVYHESPYPMLHVQLDDTNYKDILLLGFGKFGPNAYLNELRATAEDLQGKQLQIEGQLIYYNGKTLLEIDDSQKIRLLNKQANKIPIPSTRETITVSGEVVDPKCYFGVMKPGYGKIHRSCAALCISGGIPPVLVAQDENTRNRYFLLTDMKGKTLHQDILPYIGQPAQFSGERYTQNGWEVLRVDTANIVKMEGPSTIYN